MASPQQTTRGCVYPAVYPVFRGDGEWAPIAPSDVQNVEKDLGQADHPLDLSVASLYHGRGLLGHYLGTL